MPKSNFRSLFITLFFIAFLANASVVIWLMFVSSAAPRIELVQPIAVEHVALCPDDILTHDFTIQVDKPVTVDLSYFIVSGSGASRVTLEQIVFSGPVTLTLSRQWIIPHYYPDVSSENVNWQPGIYRHRIQARITGSERTQGEVDMVFEIGKDCPL
jgi:hypothetical protein